MSTPYISAAAFEKLRSTNSSLTIIDLRSNAEHSREQLQNAIHIPIQKITPQTIKSLCEDKTDKQVFLLCQSGMRAKAAVKQLGQINGVEWVIIDGGINGIKSVGGELIQGESTIISLERQVRITAGSAIIIGTLLGLLVNPAFIAIAGFVGAGLVFAGVTDRCGLAIVLSRMPWNQ